MKKKLPIILSGSAILISFSAIILVLCRIEPIRMDWMGILVGILSLLVTILIGFQIFNYISFEKRMDGKVRKEMNKAKNDVRAYSDLILTNYFHMQKYDELVGKGRECRDKGDYVNAIINDLSAYSNWSKVKVTGRDPLFFTLQTHNYRNYARQLDFMVDKGFSHFTQQDIDRINNETKWMTKENLHKRDYDDIIKDIETFKRLTDKMSSALKNKTNENQLFR